MLNINNLIILTTSPIYQHGEEYFSSEAVTRLNNSGNDWSAVVEGSNNYRVRVLVQDNEVADWDCNCPFDHGPVCKHVVAVALAIEECFESEETEVNSTSIHEDETQIPEPIKIKDLPAKEIKRLLRAVCNT